MFDHLSTDAVIVAVLTSSTLLLAGFLLHLRQMYADLSRKAEALDKSEKRIRTLGDNLPNETLFQLVCSPGNRFSFNYITKGYERATGIDRQAGTPRCQVGVRSHLRIRYTDPSGGS